MTSFDSTFTNNNSDNNNNNNNSLRKKIVVGGALALLLGVATYSSNGATKSDSIYKNLLRSNQGTVSETADIGVLHSNSNTIGAPVGTSGGGAAYTMSNNDVENKLLIFKRNVDSDGKVAFSKSVSMHGRGTSLGGAVDPLTSQDPIIVDATGSCIIGVNAGSHSVAIFKINDKNDPTDVSFVKTYVSGGFFPVSVVSDTYGFIYVLNAGENGAIGAFYLHTDDCTMVPSYFSYQGPQSLTGQETGLAGDLDDAKPTQGPGHMLVSPDGKFLYVVVKSANEQDPTPGSSRLIKYTLRGPQESIVTPIPDTLVTFDMAMNEDGMILLANAGGFPNRTGGVVSVIAPSGSITSPETTFDKDQSLEIGFGPTCWIRYSSKKSNGCSYVTNASPNGSTITAFRSEGTKLELMGPNPAAQIQSPIDLTLSPDEKFLYVISTGFGNDDQQPAMYVYQIDTYTCGLTYMSHNSDGLPKYETNLPHTPNTNGIAGLAIV